MKCILLILIAAVTGLFDLCAQASDPNEVATQIIAQLQDQISWLQAHGTKDYALIEAIEMEQECARVEALKEIQFQPPEE
jgi:hypothetical protein